MLAKMVTAKKVKKAAPPNVPAIVQWSTPSTTLHPSPNLAVFKRKHCFRLKGKARAARFAAQGPSLSDGWITSSRRPLTWLPVHPTPPRTEHALRTKLLADSWIAAALKARSPLRRWGTEPYRGHCWDGPLWRTLRRGDPPSPHPRERQSSAPPTKGPRSKKLHQGCCSTVEAPAPHRSS
jgi:hypothetical protein